MSPNDGQKDLGIMLALLQESGTSKMPRIARIRKKVESAVRLEEAELEFLRGALKSAGEAKPVFDRQPEFQDFYARSVAELRDITRLALDNEMQFLKLV